MKDNSFRRILQRRRRNKLDKLRNFFQRQLEHENDDNTIIQTLSQIRSIDRERYLLFKISGGAAS